MEQMWISGRGLVALKQEEGFRPVKYVDIGGKWTIGYGHLLLADEDGDVVLTEGQAENLLLNDLEPLERKMVPLFACQPSQCQWDAMCSLVFNVGVGVHDGRKGDFADSSLVDKLNRGLVNEAADEFLYWCYYHDREGSKQRSEALYNRRQRERLMFLGQ